MRHYFTLHCLMCAAAFMLALVSCTPTNNAPQTPAAPTPPQVRAANDVNALAQALDAAITALRSARDSGKLSAGDVANAEKVAAIIATAGKQIDAELRSSDSWDVQKQSILKTVSSASLKNTLAALPSGAAQYLSAAVALFNSISQTVGGPTL